MLGRGSTDRANPLCSDLFFSGSVSLAAASLLLSAQSGVGGAAVAGPDYMQGAHAALQVSHNAPVPKTFALQVPCSCASIERCRTHCEPPFPGSVCGALLNWSSIRRCAYAAEPTLCGQLTARHAGDTCVHFLDMRVITQTHSSRWPA